MNKTYSISEIVEASNNILNRPQKNSQMKSVVINEKKISEDTTSKTKSSFVNDLDTEDVNIKKNYEINAEIKKEILEEIYNFFKKKIKKNTLKLIFDQQQEIKKFQKKINYLNENGKILETSNRNLLFNLLKINENKKILTEKNKKIQQEYNEKIISFEKENSNLKNQDHEIKELKNLNHEYNKKIISREEAYGDLKNKNEKLTESNNRLKFYQNENLRLASELFASHKRYDVIKKQLYDLGLQKDQISNQIQELNNLVSKSNLVVPSFTNELPSEPKEDVKAKEDIKKINNQDVTNLNKSINKIFNK